MISCREFSTRKINELTSVLSSDIYKLQSEYDASKWMGLIHVHADSQLIKHFFIIDDSSKRFEREARTFLLSFDTADTG